MAVAWHDEMWNIAVQAAWFMGYRSGETIFCFSGLFKKKRKPEISLILIFFPSIDFFFISYFKYRVRLYSLLSVYKLHCSAQKSTSFHLILSRKCWPCILCPCQVCLVLESWCTSPGHIHQFSTQFFSRHLKVYFYMLWFTTEMFFPYLLFKKSFCQIMQLFFFSFFTVPVVIFRVINHIIKTNCISLFSAYCIKMN